MRRRWPRRAALAAALAMAAAAGPGRPAALPLGQALHPPVKPIDTSVPAAVQDVGVDEKLGARLPLDASFTAEDGTAVRLRDLLGDGKPVVLAPVYYECPMLCGLILTGLARAMRESGLELGKDYRAVTLSFDPREGTKLAAERQRGYLQAFGRPELAGSWRFLTGEQAPIAAAMDAIGFRYAYDEATRQYAHAAAVVALTPDGRVSRYLYGVEIPARDLRLALVEAGEGRVGTSFDRLLLTCFRYDPGSRTYVPYALGFVRIAMLGVLGGLGLMLGMFWRREWRASRRRRASEGAP